MLVELVILGSLKDGPRHGYEIKKTVENSLGRFLKLNNNLLYPTLKRLERTGAVSCRVDVQDRRPARRVYAITPSGEALLSDLLEDAEGETRQATYAAFYVRVAFFHLVSPVTRLRILRVRQRLLLDVIAYLEDCLACQNEARPYARRLAAFSLQRHQAELEWVELLIAEEKASPALAEIGGDQHG